MKHSVLRESAAAALRRTRAANPLVHPITNFVTVNDCANIILAAGGSPTMAHDPREVEEIAAVSQAVELLAPGGVLTICVYPGHEEGTRELHALLAWAAGLDVCAYNVLHHDFIAAKAGTPHLILIQKNG